MNEREAEQILEWLSGSFGRRLEENERHVWLSTLVAMDATQAMSVAITFGKNGDRFPTVPEFRRAMRPQTVDDDSWRDLPPERVHKIPDWIHIWFWSMMTRDDHRPFPQFYPRPDNAITPAEYEIVKQEWEAVGSPTIRSVSDIADQL